MRVLHRNGDQTDTLAADVELADSLPSQLVGLMFRRPLVDGQGMVFRFGRARCRPVHTLFVRAPIDVLWIVREQVTTVETIAPWTVRRTGRCDTIVELPAGRAADVAAGDQVRLAR